VTRITAESIRAQMKTLQRHLNLLEAFAETSFSETACADEEHEWLDNGWGGHSDEASPDEAGFYAEWACKKCGVILVRNYNQHTDEYTHDPWAELRPDGGEEE